MVMSIILENPMNIRKIANDILEQVGGASNVQSLTHCFTRLRFVLRDEKKADKKKIEKLEGVISVMSAGGEFQVVCGAKVTQIYSEIEVLLDPENDTMKSSTKQEHENTKQQVNSKQQENNKHQGKRLANRILQTITQIFTPLVPAIAAAGLIKGLLTAAKLIMQRKGIDISTTDTYTILYAASQVIFYFFPIFLAMTTAKALKCNQVIAMVIAGTLVYPSIDAIIQDTEIATTIFGFPVIKGAWQIGESVKVFSYTESVIPIILAVLVMAYFEKFLKKWIPEVIQLILIPGLELLVMLPLTLCLLGPVGIYIGNAIQVGYDFVIGISPVLGGALIGGLWGVFVIFGAHRALLPIGLNDVALNGHQNILAFAGSANFAQGGAALGVLLKTKNKGLKQVAASGTIAASLVGVTEPAIYGCNLRYKKPMICAIVAGAIGGAIMGFGGVYGDAFANNGVLTIFTYAAFGMKKFVFYLIGIAVAYFGAAILTYVVGFEEDVEEDNEVREVRGEDEGRNSTRVSDSKAGDSLRMSSPMTGKLISLEEVQDKVFASKQLGDGVAILPEVGEVVAPENGTVTTIYKSLHAIGFTTDEGLEVLIHVGIDTVKLGGIHFKAHVVEGQQVRKGEKILSFDIEGIQGEGYDITTPILLTNCDITKVEKDSMGDIHCGQELFVARK